MVQMYRLHCCQGKNLTVASGMVYRTSAWSFALQLGPLVGKVFGQGSHLNTQACFHNNISCVDRAYRVTARFSYLPPKYDV